MADVLGLGLEQLILLSLFRSNAEKVMEKKFLLKIKALSKVYLFFGCIRMRNTTIP